MSFYFGNILPLSDISSYDSTARIKSPTSSELGEVFHNQAANNLSNSQNPHCDSWSARSVSPCIDQEDSFNLQVTHQFNSLYRTESAEPRSEQTIYNEYEELIIFSELRQLIDESLN